MAVDAGKAVGDIVYKEYDVAGILSSASSSLSSVVGEGASSVSGAKDFVGMDRNNIDTFKTAVDTYENLIKGIIGELSSVDWDTAVKGDVATAVNDFKIGICDLLRQFLRVIEVEKKDIMQASAGWKNIGVNVSLDTYNDIDEVGNNINKVELD